MSKTKNPKTELLSALLQGDHAAARHGIETFFNAPDAKGLTPLQAAVLHCELPTVVMLVQYGARVDQATVELAQREHPRRREAAYFLQQVLSLQAKYGSKPVPAFDIERAVTFTKQAADLALDNENLSEVANRVVASRRAASRPSPAAMMLDHAFGRGITSSMDQGGRG